MSAFPIHSRPTARHLIRFWVIGTCVCLFAFPGLTGPVPPASAPLLTASLETTTVSVGDILWLTLKADLTEGARLADPPILEGTEGLTILEQQAAKNDLKIRLLIDRLEDFEIGPFSLTGLDRDGNEFTLQSQPVLITVKSNLGEKPEEASLKPIEDILPITPKYLAYLPWILASIFLGGLLLGIFLWRKRHRSNSINAAVSDPPHVRAEKEIDRLLADGWFEKGEVKTFYFIFSEIIRRYMELIRHFPAAEMTTEEILRQIGPEPQNQPVLQLLSKADLVKFADAVPDPADKERDIETARNYIRLTSPRPEEENGPPQTEVAP